MANQVNPSFWHGKKVLVTGHTGFKGTWLCELLIQLGADVSGISKPPLNEKCIFNSIHLNERLSHSFFVDINDFPSLESALDQICPDIIFHLAAQPIVGFSYLEPRETYLTNVIGTVNLYESSRNLKNLSAIITITTDKCYKNIGNIWPYRESDSLGGYDPYSASKACVELVTDSYKNSFFLASGSNTGIASARAGNVIGGGDWSNERLIPDLIRSMYESEPMVLRNPSFTRPWQHVLEPLLGYVLLAQKLTANPNKFSDAYNFGPEQTNVLSVLDLLKICDKYGFDSSALVVNKSPSYHESKLLSLDSSRSKATLGWSPRLTINEAVELTLSWYDAYYSNMIDMYQFTVNQINNFLS